MRAARPFVRVECRREFLATMALVMTRVTVQVPARVDAQADVQVGAQIGFHVDRSWPLAMIFSGSHCIRIAAVQFRDGAVSGWSVREGLRRVCGLATSGELQ